MKNKLNKLKANSLTFRILLIVLFGITTIAIVVSSVVLIMSTHAFTDTYGRAQEQVFVQIEENLNDFHTSVQNMCDAIDSSWAFRLFLTENDALDNISEFQMIYQMEADLDASNTTDIDRLNILILGLNGRNYLTRTETVIMDNGAILSSEAVRQAITQPDTIHYTYSKGAYTTTSRNSDVIIVSKALYLKESRQIYGIILLTLTMDNMASFYDYFISDNTDWYMVDSNDIIMCSSVSSAIGNTLDTAWYSLYKDSADGRYTQKTSDMNVTVLKSDLSYYNCTMYGVIDNKVALEGLYNMPLLIFTCVLIAILLILATLFSLQKVTSPLSKLTDKMSKSSSNTFLEHVPVEGSSEICLLAETYNHMLDDISHYIDQIVHTQKAQRNAEIKALQMQINPHYIYNTLASIKWLVYEGNVEKTVSTIDAFIALLRNTISNSEEFITLEQELVNLENYVLITHTRYGNDIVVEYDIAPECYDCPIPKMVLQPFIENAFFHAFPGSQKGTIKVIARLNDNDMTIQICDDGVGIDDGEKKNTSPKSKEHFSGIGIHNVDQRLRLLYGDDYGATVYSRKNEGTTITVRFPKATP